jgi:hypothetical protein
MSHNEISQIIRDRVKMEIGTDLNVMPSASEFVKDADNVIYRASHYCDTIITDAVNEVVANWKRKEV